MYLIGKLFECKQQELAPHNGKELSSENGGHEAEGSFYYSQQSSFTESSVNIIRFISPSRVKRVQGCTGNILNYSVCVCNQGTEEDEQKLTKCTSLLESQHHHLLHCLEKTTVSASPSPSLSLSLFDFNWFISGIKRTLT